MQAHLQHSTGIDAICRERTFPLGCGMCTRNTSRTLVFFLPISVSPFRSSISEFRSFKIPAQSILQKKKHFNFIIQKLFWTTQLHKYVLQFVMSCAPIIPAFERERSRRISSYSSALATQWAQDQNGLQETLSQSQTKIFQKEFCNPNLVKNKYLKWNNKRNHF